MYYLTPNYVTFHRFFFYLFVLPEAVFRIEMARREPSCLRVNSSEEPTDTSGSVRRHFDETARKEAVWTTEMDFMDLN